MTNPVPKMTTTMNSDPATIPTHAATLFNRPDSWTYTGAGGIPGPGVGGGVSTGPVAGSEFSGGGWEVAVGSLMAAILRGELMRAS